MTSTQTTKRQFKLYILHEDELVKNSPYTIEGTDTVLDIPAVRNLPWRYSDAQFNGEVRAIRYVRSCASIYVDEQIKMGYPLDRKPTVDEFNDLVIKNGQLLAQRKNLMEYIDALPINASSQHRLLNSRKFIQESDPENDLKISFETEEAKAKYGALCFSISEAKAKDLIRLRYHNYPTNDPRAVRIELRRMVMEDNDGVAFMMKHLKDTTEDSAIIILCTKAQEMDLLNFNIIPGHVAIMENGSWAPLVKISDNGGQPMQFNRLVDWLKTQDGNMYIDILKAKVKGSDAAEEDAELADKEDDEKLIDELLNQQAKAILPKKEEGSKKEKNVPPATA